MVEEQRNRIQSHLTRLLDDLDRSYLRKMQIDTHKCAITCCQNDSYGLEDVQNCMRNCEHNLQEVNVYIQNELQRFENRLQRCVQDCNDSIKSKLGPNPTDDDVNKYRTEFEVCATKCVNTYCDLLPELERNIKKGLNSRKTK